MVQFSSLTGSGGSSASGCGARRSRKFGGNSEGVTPLPIPNRAVKPLSADGTWCASAWESRSPPVNFYAEAVLKGKASVVEHRLSIYRWRLLKRADEACALEALRPTSPDQLGRRRTAGVAAGVRTGGRSEGLPTGIAADPLVTDHAGGCRLQSELSQRCEIDHQVEAVEGSSQDRFLQRDHGRQATVGTGQTFAFATHLAPRRE